MDFNLRPQKPPKQGASTGHGMADTAAARGALSPKSGGKVDYHAFLESLTREAMTDQPLFGEMMEHDADLDAQVKNGKAGVVKPKAQGFK